MYHHWEKLENPTWLLRHAPWAASLIPRAHACTRTRPHTHARARTHTHTHTRAHTHMRAHTHTWTHTRTNTLSISQSLTHTTQLYASCRCMIHTTRYFSISHDSWETDTRCNTYCNTHCNTRESWDTAMSHISCDSWKIFFYFLFFMCFTSHESWDSCEIASWNSCEIACLQKSDGWFESLHTFTQ
jgi:hypothetical protein